LKCDRFRFQHLGTFGGHFLAAAGAARSWAEVELVAAGAAPETGDLGRWPRGRRRGRGGGGAAIRGGGGSRSCGEALALPSAGPDAAAVRPDVGLGPLHLRLRAAGGGALEALQPVGWRGGGGGRVWPSRRFRTTGFASGLEAEPPAFG